MDKKQNLKRRSEIEIAQYDISGVVRQMARKDPFASQYQFEIQDAIERIEMGGD